MGSDGTFPPLAAGSVRPVISLLSLQPRSSAANPPPPSETTETTGSSQLPLEAVSDPSGVEEVEEEMRICSRTGTIYLVSSWLI